jgi:hypothetical protein
MPSKKNSLPTVWHNSLVNLRSNLHQEPLEIQNYVYVLPPLENLHQESLWACLISWPYKAWPGSQSLASHSPARDIQAACLIRVA